ncbi:MFS transporter [Aeromicrobium chenweiae]|uniref:MFS transporter n=1 Tax=Aeromicrobium chenweiae TaxID=2079793 RepID=A0A2S0WKC7_9ACTN|nr:MFS transporter [Aeromicrobium chenweiae]AWB91796.1 MFS transporter [Aeromicrobium chenweiae]TGN32640.1 MFS transporter [Aeromicrobium chenweiae]
MPRLTGARAFTVVVLAFLVTMVGTTLPTPLYGLYQDEIGFSLTTITVVFATYAFGVLAALLLFGRWSDAIGRRPLLLAGLTISLTSDLVFLVADATWLLLVARAVSGVSAGIYVGTATAAVLEAAPERWRARAPLVATVANIGGLGLGPVVAAGLVDVFPWPLHLTFVVHAVAALLVLGLLTRVPETVEVSPGARPRLQRPLVPASARTTFIGAGIAGFAGFAVSGLFTAVSPRFVAEAVDSPSPLVSVSVVFALFASSVVAQVLLHRLPTDPGVNLGCSLLFVGLVLFTFSLSERSLWLMLVAGVVAGAGQGIAFSKGLAAVLARVASHERAGTTSAFFVVAYVAISVPVIGSGIASDHWGLDPTGIAFSVAAAVLAALALVTLVVDQRRSAASIG